MWPGRRYPAWQGRRHASACRPPSNLPVAPAALSFRGNRTTDYGVIFAAYVSISLPLIVVFSIFTRQFVRGIEGI